MRRRSAGTLLPGVQHDDVARHQPFGRDGAARAVAEHRGDRRQHLPDRVHGLFRLAFLDEADDRIDQDDGEDDRRVDGVAEKRGDHGRGEKDVDQDVVELRQEPHERASPRRLGR